jgi:CHAT domain-containing protein
VLAIAVRDCGAPEFEVLPNVEREVEQVREFYQARGVAVDVLQGDDAKRSTLEHMRAEGRLSRYRYVHLGTHGESALAAPNAPLEAKLHLRLSHLDSMDIAMLGMRAEVVVLSACCSGQRAVVGRGSDSEPKDLGMDAGLPGDEIFGMQAALFQSGVHAVLGALWPVDVEPTATIIPEFHRGLSENLPAEVALQSAVARYLQTMQDPWLRKAVNWAPFFVSTMGGRIQGE